MGTLKGKIPKARKIGVAILIFMTGPLVRDKNLQTFVESEPEKL